MGVEVLGRGGFSVVYSATDTRFDRRVAIKVLTTFDDESDRRRFDRERRVMGRLSSHPNVVTVYESGYTPDGLPYLVMELIGGGSLGDRLAATGPLPWREAVDAILPIAAAVGVAHESNVLHRDIKPDNILVGADGVKLTDFGISSFRDSTGATSTHIAASWHHTPPETFPNKRDARSDLYSLGSTLYSLLTGKPPLWRESDESLEPLMYRILNEAPASLPADVAPPAVDRFLQRVLAKDPAARPQTAGAFIAELTDAAAGVDPPFVAAVPVVEHGSGGPPSSIRRWAAAGLTAGVLVVGSTGFVLANRSDDPASSTTTDPTTTQPTTATTAQDPAPAADLPSYRDTNVVPLSADITEFADFLGDHQNEIVELDVVVTLPSLDDFFEDGGAWFMPLYEDCDGADEPSALNCSGYQLRFLAESAGTTSVGWYRGDTFRIFGYFTVGQLVGPNQGYLTIILDPLAAETALS